MAIASYAMGVTVAYNYIRGEFIDEPVPRFKEAVKEAYESGYLGKNIKDLVLISIFTHSWAPVHIFVVKKQRFWSHSKESRANPDLSHHFLRITDCTVNPLPSIIPKVLPVSPQS